MDKYIFSGILIATLLSMVNHRAPFPQNKQIIEPAVQQALSVGQQIQLARIRKGFSQRYLSRLSGVSFNTINDIEKGNTIPTLNQLHRIQEIIGGGIVVNGDALARL